MPIRPYSGHYNAGRLRAFPNHLWVFGDNLTRVGHGGQAIIRDEPNALGIATKRSTSVFMEPGNPDDMSAVAADCHYVETLHEQGRFIVIPTLADTGKISLGCGLAELPERCPDIYLFLELWFKRLLETN